MLKIPKATGNSLRIRLASVVLNFAIFFLKIFFELSRMVPALAYCVQDLFKYCHFQRLSGFDSIKTI